jgi:hypothetical protein
MKRSMGAFERQILDFVLAWAPYGGPRDDDTFPEFGLHVSQLHDRFRHIVVALMACGDSLDERDRDLLARAHGYIRAAARPSKAMPS